MKPVKKTVAAKKAAVAKKTAATNKYLYWAGLAVIALVYLNVYGKTFDSKPDLNGDNIYYYALGNALAEGKGYVNTIGFDETPHTHYPPGYPFLISMGIRAGLGITGIKILNGVLLLLAALLLYRLAYRLSRNVFVAVAAGLLTAVNPHLLRSATIMMSEVPFLFLSTLTLLLFTYLVEKKTFDRAYFLLLAGVGAGTVAAFYVRTMGIALWLGLLCGLLTIVAVNVFRHNRGMAWKQRLLTGNRPLLTALAALLVFFLLCKLPWDLRSEALGVNNSYIGQLSLQTGGTHITGLGGWADRVAGNSARYLTKEIPGGLFARQVSYEVPAGAPDWLLGVPVLALIAVGAVGLWRQHRRQLFLLYYLGGTAAILLLWPDIWTGTRFLSPLIPLLLWLFMLGVVKVLRWLLALVHIKAAGVSTAAMLVLMTALCYPGYSDAVRTARQLAQFGEYTEQLVTPPLAEYIHAMKWVKDHLPDSGRVCTRKPELFYIYSGGKKSVSFPYYATPEEIITFLHRHRIRYIIIDRWFRHAYATVVPAVQKFPTHFRIIHQIGGANNQPPTYVLEFVGS